ncbi:DNA polymerase III subunits gamma and tau [Jannaschia aquimarina]|uniref:DNA polymerase III subunits gamma and tau n=1 Tax=Jannaschia aquimarina TaxID=935700 RepID=A0A0D1DAV5_9RHOB|nr:DNA polymerase III subunits gamma and tau [Jannaschia aquimarina]
MTTARARTALAPAAQEEAGQALARFGTFAQVVDLIRANRDPKLLYDVETGVRLVHYAPGRIEFEPPPGAPADLAARLSGRLQGWTGARWGVSVVGEGGAPSIAEVRDADRLAAEAEALAHPSVQAAMQAFPGAKLVEIRTRADLEAEAAAEALEEVEDEWDPFADE